MDFQVPKFLRYIDFKLGFFGLFAFYLFLFDFFSFLGNLES